MNQISHLYSTDTKHKLKNMRTVDPVHHFFQFLSYVNEKINYAKKISLTEKNKKIGQ
jgi:hypothetical protein